MKSLLLTIAWIFVIGWACLAFSSCATVKSKTTVTAPDGTVTVTESETNKPVEGVLPFAGEVLKAYSPRRIDDAK